MWEMIDRMFGDTLWIYTAIAGALLGAAFLFWFKNTRMATWGAAKFAAFLEHLANKWGWTWLQDDPEAWRKKYPKITAKIDDIEERLTMCSGMQHPPKDLNEFEQWGKLDARLKKIEKQLKALQK